MTTGGPTHAVVIREPSEASFVHRVNWTPFCDVCIPAYQELLGQREAILGNSVIPSLLVAEANVVDAAADKLSGNTDRSSHFYAGCEGAFQQHRFDLG